MLSQRGERDAVAKLIVDACKKHNFDGIVLEVWQSLAKRIEDSFLYSLVKDIGRLCVFHHFHVILDLLPYLQGVSKILFFQPLL